MTDCLTGGLHNCLTSIRGSIAPAVTSLQEVAAIVETLADTDPDTYKPVLDTVLANLEKARAQLGPA